MIKNSRTGEQVDLDCISHSPLHKQKRRVTGNPQQSEDGTKAHEKCVVFLVMFLIVHIVVTLLCVIWVFLTEYAKPTTTARGKANKKTGDAREWGKHTRCEIKNLSVGVRRLKISWGINHSRRDTETCSDFDLSPSNLILHAAQLRPASPSGKSARLSIHLSWMFWWSSPNRITHTHTHTQTKPRPWMNLSQHTTVEGQEEVTAAWNIQAAVR